MFTEKQLIAHANGRMPDVAFIQGWGNDECLVGLQEGVACLKDDI